MPTEKTYAELKAEIDAGIRVNGNREITPPIHNAIETDLAFSFLNKKDGGTLQQIIKYVSHPVFNDDLQIVDKKYIDDALLNLEGYLIQGENILTEDLIFDGPYNIGFGGEPFGKVHFILPNDTSPLSKTQWTGVDVVFGEDGNQGKALGVSYTNSSSAINLNFLEPSVQWLASQLNAKQFAFYSSGVKLGLFQDFLGMVCINTDTPASGALLTIRGSDDSDDDYQLRTFNASAMEIFHLRNDGRVFVNGELVVPDINIPGSFVRITAGSTTGIVITPVI